MLSKLSGISCSTDQASSNTGVIIHNLFINNNQNTFCPILFRSDNRDQNM